MGEQLHFSMDGEFLTAIARDWFWNMDKPYKKCEELLLSCMMGGNEEEKRHVCQDIIEGRKKLVGVNEFELVDDNVHVRSLGQKVEELQHKMLVNQIREDMIAHPLNYVDRFAMTDSYETLCTNAKHHYIDCSYDGIKCFLYGKTGYSDAFNNGAWLFTHPDLVAEFNGEPLPEQESNPEFYKTDFWTKLASWIEANMKGTSVERRQRLYNSYISNRPIQHQLTEYGLIAPDGTWYACEFGEHAALAGRIIMRNREAFGLSDHEVLNMAYDWSGKGLDFLYKRGWIAIRNPSMGNTFLDMDETKTATKAQLKKEIFIMTSNMTMTAISICDFLKLIVKSTVKHYTEDFKLDIKIFKRYAKEAQETGKAVPMLWFCRYNGTYLCLEEDAYKVGTSMFNTFKYYDENMEDEARTIKAFLVTVTGMEERKPIGCITPINYKGECDRIRHYAVPSHNVEVIYKNGTLIQEREVFDKYPIVKHPKFGTIREAKFLADDPDALDYALHMARNERKAG